MERNVKQIGLINLLAMLAVAAMGFVLARYANSASGVVGSMFFGFGFLVMAVSYFQMRLEETERTERLEFDELNRTKGSSSLFSSADAEAFPAQRSREQFERFFVPGFTVVLFLLQAGGAYWSWNWLKNPPVSLLNQPTVAMSLFALFALALFLLGKFSAGIAQLRNDRLLRPGASYLLLGAYLCFIVAASIAGVQLGFPRTDLYAARGLGVFLALTAVESLFSLILEIYRPRRKGPSPRVLYDSRLISLLGRPEGLFTTAAHALDYQFGFKVSDTWLYRFFEKAFAWLLLLQIGLLTISSCVVFISTGEQGLLERWGRPVTDRAVLNPGLHWKWPYPMDRVLRFRTEQIQQFSVGTIPEASPTRTIVWTSAHEKEPFNLLVASRQSLAPGVTNALAADQGAPVDLLTVGIPVQYQIKDVRAWAYHYTDAGALLEKIATREVVRYFVNVDLFELMSTSRERASQELQKRIQERADERNLGVRILLVGLQDVHPPLGKEKMAVAAKFEEVVGAQQEVQARLREAEGYAAGVLPRAKAEAERIVREAEANKVRAISEAVARAARFTNQLLAYQASPRVYMERAYLEAFVQSSTNARKYVIMTTNRNGVIQLNLEDKVAAGLLSVPLPETKK